MLSKRLEKHSIPEPNTGCVLWFGSVKENGYGAIRVDGRTLYAHRVAWELEKGPVPKGMHVCHRCDVRACINPQHMFLGAQRDNIHDMVAKGRQSRGEKRPHAKLTESDVREIRASRETHVALAPKYGVNFQTIAKVRAHASWRHVE